MRSDRPHAFAPMVNYWQRRNTPRAQPSYKIVNLRRISDRNNLRAVAFDLPGQFVKIASRRQRDHRKSLRKCIHHRKTLLPNRARRSQDGQFPEGCRHHYVLSDSRSPKDVPANFQANKLKSNNTRLLGSPRLKRQYGPKSRHGPAIMHPNLLLPRCAYRPIPAGPRPGPPRYQHPPSPADAASERLATTRTHSLPGASPQNSLSPLPKSSSDSSAVQKDASRARAPRNTRPCRRPT